MNEISNTIKQLGFDEWFQDRTDTKELALHDIARVVSAHKESYVISKGDTEIYAELAGRLLYTADSSLDLPTTGDWVYVDCYDDDSHGIIHGLLPRKTLLRRKTAGKNVDFQLIAANIDVAFILQSLNENFNLRRLERYLVMVNESEISPVVLLSKSDLNPAEDTKQKIASIREIMPEVPVIAFSNENGENIDTIKNLFIAGKTYCLLGSSGVGKTTLVNSLSGEVELATQSVSEKESKGRHTTTNRQLIKLALGANLIDTPGMRELGNLSNETGIEETFSDIVALAEQCKFGDCQHNNEKGCAISKAINIGQLDINRYNNYLKMKKESAFNQMSYAEKKNKDKNFGKLIKKTLADKKKRR
ncbi:ribosome small subunit-dependent GTPase A [Aurantivibrio infirmus]